MSYLSSPKRVTWDEEKILEHDKERGTRMKIDEPPTPYVHPTLLNGLISPSDHHSKIGGSPLYQFPVSEENEMSDLSLGNPSSTTSNAKDQITQHNESISEGEESDKEKQDMDIENGNDGGEESEVEKHRREFIEARKNHYNEFEVLKQWRERIVSKNDQNEPSKQLMDEDVDQKEEESTVLNNQDENKNSNMSPTQISKSKRSASKKSIKKSISPNKTNSIDAKDSKIKEVDETDAPSSKITKKENYSTSKPERKVKLDGNR